MARWSRAGWLGGVLLWLLLPGLAVVALEFVLPGGPW